MGSGIILSGKLVLHFGGIHSLKMEAVCSSEMSVLMYWTLQYHNPEDHNVDSFINLAFYFPFYFFLVLCCFVCTFVCWTYFLSFNVTNAVTLLEAFFFYFIIFLV
jgi:hypothetical protein